MGSQVGQIVEEQVGRGRGVTDVAGADRGRGDDLGVRVDRDVAL
jgi:hypothetical protein